MESVKHNDTKSKLGDIYHYINVLEYCFQMKDGEKIYVEEYGDITLESPSDATNVEVKHHLENHEVTDRDRELWNTLKNWVAIREQLKSCVRLVLLTTSTVSESSIFHDWASKSGEQRVALLKKVGLEKKDREKTFRPLYEAVFDCDENELAHILERVELSTGNVSVNEKLEQLKRHNVLMTVNEENKDPFIKELVGEIILRPVDPPYGWELTYDYFKQVLVRLRDQFSSGKIPIPSPPEVESVIDEKTLEKRFVLEIKRIEHDTFIPQAIRDYSRAMKVIAQLFDQSPYYGHDLEKYQDSLLEVLQLHRSTCQNNWRINGSFDGHLVFHSQKFYNTAMLHTPLALKYFSENKQYFQNGVIQSIVDEGRICWHLEDAK